MPNTESGFPRRMGYSSLSDSSNKVLHDRSSTSGRYCLPPSAPIKARFGQRLRHLRLERKMTQVALANYLGLDRSFISDIERGKKSMSLSYLETVAQRFKLSLTELFTDL